MINAPVEIKVRELLKQYVLRVGLGPGVINNGIHFLYEGRKLKKDDEDKIIKEVFREGTHNIIVFDSRHLLAKFLSNIK